MHFNWNEQTIRWFLDASAYTGFHRKLARKIAPYLAQNSTLCDIGCGLGRLDLNLAPFVSELICVDINEEALSVLQRDAVSAGAANIRVLHQDAGELRRCFDTVLLSFFGQSSMLDFLNLCSRKLIRVVSAEAKSGLYPERHRRNDKATVSLVSDELNGLGIPFKLETCAFEFGQPLTSWQDAVFYVRHNAPNADAEEIDAFLHERLENTGREDFPYFLPSKKELGIFIIDKD